MLEDGGGEEANDLSSLVGGYQMLEVLFGGRAIWATLDVAVHNAVLSLHLLGSIWKFAVGCTSQIQTSHCYSPSSSVLPASRTKSMQRIWEPPRKPVQRSQNLFCPGRYQLLPGSFRRERGPTPLHSTDQPPLLPLRPLPHPPGKQ